MKAELMMIANFLTTHRESKKHGGYNIYREEGKIEISYDTYYPNVGVYVWAEGKKKLAAIFSGHGHTQEYHGGAWEGYVLNTLYPKALEAKAAYDERKKAKDAEAERARTARPNDSATFA